MPVWQNRLTAAYCACDCLTGEADRSSRSRRSPNFTFNSMCSRRFWWAVELVLHGPVEATCHITQSSWIVLKYRMIFVFAVRWIARRHLRRTLDARGIVISLILPVQKFGSFHSSQFLTLRILWRYFARVINIFSHFFTFSLYLSKPIEVVCCEF